MHKYDLDTLINPDLFKNMFDPSIAKSDSTPTLNPIPCNIDASGNSGDTSVSSISIDQVQNALQHASITDLKKQQMDFDLERKGGDGK